MRNFLSNLLATFTGPRYFPEFQWSYLWTHNVFRFFGMIFGEHYGIRPSIYSWRGQGGKTYQIGFTIEARIALLEHAIRAFFKSFAFEIVWLPKIQLAGIGATGLLPYRFAITASANYKDGGTTNSNTLASVVTSGSNIAIAVAVTGDINVTDNLTGVTYNSVALTFGSHIRSPADRWNDLYIGGNISATTASVVTSGNTFNNIGSMSYTGCANTQPDASNTSTGATSPNSISITVVAANSWLLAFDYAPGTYGSSGGSVVRGTGPTWIGGAAMFDSNAAVASGSQSVACTAAAGTYVMPGISIAPFIAVATTTTPYLFNLLGVGQ